METKREYNSKKSRGTRLEPPSMYNVIMHNDDFTPMSFVVDILVRHFDKSNEEATRLMLEVHNNKRSVAGTYPYDIAITKCYRALNEAKESGYPFKMVVDKA